LSKISEFWKANTAGGRMAWPDDPEGRDALARSAFGTAFVEAIDYWLRRADDLVDNPSPPSEPWKRATEDAAYRPTFAAMSESQRELVRKLVRHTALGVVFTSLTNLDQWPPGHFEISLTDGEGGGPVVRGTATSPPGDLHDGLYDWVWEFSEYASILMSRTPMQAGGRVDRWDVSGGKRQDT
jgi:hypothetical protein